MRRLLNLLVMIAFSAGVLGAPNPAEAQFGKLKDKAKKKAEEKVDKKVDETLEGSEKPAEGEEAAEEPEAAGAQPAAGAKGTATSESMTLYTKYDFIPGDKVIFYDDFSGEEMGEFPSRWNLDEGVFEIVKQGSRNWIMCTDEGTIRPRVAEGPLPAKYTFEMDFYSKGEGFKGHWFRIHWYNAKGEDIGNIRLQDKKSTSLRIMNKDIASKTLPADLGEGVHTMRIMATKSTIKCYIDNQRVANVPAVEGFQPTSIRVHMDPWLDEPENPMLLGTVRYAEGGKTMKEQLDEAGRIVTHGILFDSGSDKVKAESYKTLAEIGAMLTDNPTLRLSIEGHTDSDGATEANQALSEKRAAAARTYLVNTYKVDAVRLESKGWGEGQPIDTNDTPEGKANNRRVELVKL